MLYNGNHHTKINALFRQIYTDNGCVFLLCPLFQFQDPHLAIN